MGLAKTSLMLGIYAAATNLRMLRNWTARQTEIENARIEPAITRNGQPPRTHDEELARRRPAD